MIGLGRQFSSLRECGDAVGRAADLQEKITARRIHGFHGLFSDLSNLRIRPVFVKHSLNIVLARAHGWCQKRAQTIWLRPRPAVLFPLGIDMNTFTGAIGTGGKWLLDRIVGALAATGINPNLLTFLGLLVNFGAAASFAVGNFRTGAIIIFIAGFLDMLDGQVARRQDRVTPFGAFYDSTLDRYADMALYMGLLVYYSVSGRTPYVVLAAVATAGSVMVSYSRARAESLIPLCKVGFMERPERMVLLIIGGAFNRMGPVLWVIAVVSTITVIHRIVYTWQETKAGRILPSLKPNL